MIGICFVSEKWSWVRRVHLLPEMLILAGGTSNMYPVGPPILVIGDPAFTVDVPVLKNWVFIAKFDWRAKKFKVHQSSPFNLFTVWFES